MKKGLNIYIANLGAYNEGRLEGEWVTLPITDEELQEVFTRIGIDGVNYEEYAIHDFDNNTGLNLDITEYTSIRSLNELAETLENYDDYELEQIKAYCNVTGSDLMETLENREFENCAYVECENQDDDTIAYAMIEDFYGGLDFLSDDTLETYFDLEGFGRDLQFDFELITEGMGEEDKEELEDMDESEFAEWYIDSLGDIKELGRSILKRYFDFDYYGRDLQLDNVTYDENTNLIVIE